jgi:hypothetical protein
VLSHTSSIDQISTTVASVLSDYFKSSERTVFWNDELKRNVDPFVGLEGGFFTADWDFKVRVSSFSVMAILMQVYPMVSSKYYASWWSCSYPITLK